MGAIILIFQIIFHIVFTCQSSVVPKKCYISDSNCLIARAQENVGIFTQGLEEIPTDCLDPLCIDLIKIEKDGLVFEGRSIEKEGLKDSIIDELRIDMASRVMRLVFYTDFKIKGQYNMDGYLFKMPISGEGDLEITFNNTNVVMNMEFEIFLDSLNRSFMDLKNFTYNVDVKGGANFKFSNLYYGDQEKSDHVHTYFVENWKLTSQVFGPIIIDEGYPKIFNAIATFMRSKPLQDLHFQKSYLEHQD